MHTINNYHCCNDYCECLTTTWVPVNNTHVVLEYKTKSTDHIESLIFFPSMSTARILKLGPFEFERERERERERESMCM